MNKLFKNELFKMVFSLVIISLVCSAVLGAVNAVTYDKILELNTAAQNAAMSQVLPSAATFEDKTEMLDAAFLTDNAVNGVFAATDGAGNSVGTAVVVAPNGFGGEIVMIVGIDGGGAVTGVVITELSETPGLGMNATEDSFLSQFDGKSGSLSVVKSGAGENQINAIAGATITSRAVTDGVLAAMKAAGAI
jgi:electron transport complex protein RnfG